jgi:hypothetical protein
VYKWECGPYEKLIDIDVEEGKKSLLTALCL